MCVCVCVCVCVRVCVCVFWCVCALSQVLKSSWSYFWVKTSCPSGQSLCLWLLLSKILLPWRVPLTLLDIELGRADVSICATLNFSTFVALSTFHKGLSFSTSRKCNKRLTVNSELSHCAKWTWERHLSGVVYSVRQLSREFEKSWHLLSLSQGCQILICIGIVWVADYVQWHLGAQLTKTTILFFRVSRMKFTPKSSTDQPTTDHLVVSWSQRRKGTWWSPLLITPCSFDHLVPWWSPRRSRRPICDPARPQSRDLDHFPDDDEAKRICPWRGSAEMMLPH